MYKFIFSIVIFLMHIWSIQIIAQTKRVDSLERLLNTDKMDTNRVIHLYTLSHEKRLLNDYNAALTYGLQSLQLAQEINHERGIANSHNYIANVYYFKGNFSEALEHQKTCLKIKQEQSDSLGMAAALNNIGAI